MPALSATRPMSPSRASISRTRWPLPSPPMAGLQDIVPIVAKESVTSAVLAPLRADTAADSQPAWPPPTTITSKVPGILSPFFRIIPKMFHVKHFHVFPRCRAQFIIGLIIKKFHVKQFGPLLLPDTKPRKNLAQNILDVHHAG